MAGNWADRRGGGFVGLRAALAIATGLVVLLVGLFMLAPPAASGQSGSTYVVEVCESDYSDCERYEVPLGADLRAVPYDLLGASHSLCRQADPSGEGTAVPLGEDGELVVCRGDFFTSEVLGLGLQEGSGIGYDESCPWPGRVSCQGDLRLGGKRVLIHRFDPGPW